LLYIKLISMPLVTHFFKTFYPHSQGGIEEVIRQIGIYSIANGYKVRVVSVSENQSHDLIDGIIADSYKKSFGISSMPVSIDLAKHFNKIVEDTDIIHLHYPYPFTEIMSLSPRIKKPIVVTYHAPIVGRNLLMRCYSPFARRLFQKASVIVPTSQNLADSEKILRDFKSKIRPIGLWVGNGRFDDSTSVDETFKKEVSALGEYALFAGVLRKYKGLHYLLDAAKNVDKNIAIVGKGPLEKDLLKRIETEKIHNVHMFGYQNDNNLSYLFKHCSFFVLPSQTRGECFGVVLLEACHYAKAMISTELGTGTSWVNKDGLTGFVVPPGDYFALSQKMNFLFENPEQCRLMGDNAFRRSCVLFDPNKLGTEYLKIYRELL
jgi:glycosyltransferase involved in cell wall biosynthesis